MRFTVIFLSPFFFLGCTAASWTDTFHATGTRGVEDAGAVPDDAGGAVQQCAGLAATKSPPSIVVTFPGHGTANESVHVVSGSQTCDLHVDTDTDAVLFVGDALPCASMLAVGTPSSATATISGLNSPTDLLFQWSYSSICTIDDDYPLERQ
jgi:hypothetical protein